MFRYELTMKLQDTHLPLEYIPSSEMEHDSGVITYIDLFAGMGGTRIGFENSLNKNGLTGKCVFSSEIKIHARKAYQHIFDEDHIYGDITTIAPSSIPDFNYLLAGFPCQPFSSAGTRKGFLDERGGLFFTICSILETKQPEGFLLENVDGLVTHEKGKTLEVVLNKLIQLGYNVEYKVLDSSEFDIPQQRKRVYIIGGKSSSVKFESHEIRRKYAVDCIDYKMHFKESDFSKLLRNYYTLEQLEGKSIKDKRGGKNNIHSWDIGYKGKINQRQHELLSEIIKKRRYKKWAERKGIAWMDGMPLTLEEISTFCKSNYLKEDLEYLVDCGYLKFEHPKDLIVVDGVKKRIYKKDSPKGYNIVAGKLSYPFSKILNPNDIVPTIVATEIGKLAVSTNYGVRSISVKEGLLFSGYYDDYDLDMLTYSEAFDLIGNTVMPPVIEFVTDCLLKEKYASR